MRPFPLPGESDVHAHARQQLTRVGIIVKQIIRVDPDSILFIGGKGFPMTAWLERNPQSGAMNIGYEQGFPAVRGDRVSTMHTVFPRDDGQLPEGDFR